MSNKAPTLKQRVAMREVALFAESALCTELNHKETEHHRPDEQCPAEMRMLAYVKTVSDYLDALGESQ